MSNYSPTKKKRQDPLDESTPAIPPPTSPFPSLFSNSSFGNTPQSLINILAEETPLPFMSPLPAGMGNVVLNSRDWTPTLQHSLLLDQNFNFPVAPFSPSQQKFKPKSKYGDETISISTRELDDHNFLHPQSGINSQSHLDTNKAALFNRIHKNSTPSGLALDSPMPLSAQGTPFGLNSAGKSFAFIGETSPAGGLPAMLDLQGSQVFKPSIKEEENKADSSGLEAIIAAAAENITPGHSNEATPEGYKVAVSNPGSAKKLSLTSPKRDFTAMRSTPSKTSMISPELLELHISRPTDEANKSVICNCKKSRCLKMYCDCFRLTLYCNESCHCKECANLEKYKEQRQAAIDSIVERNPEAFKPRVLEDPSSNAKGHLTGCHCRKSSCLKKYCECFNGHVPCTPKCRCVDCKNIPELHADDDEVRLRALKMTQESALKDAQLKRQIENARIFEGIDPSNASRKLTFLDSETSNITSQSLIDSNENSNISMNNMNISLSQGERLMISTTNEDTNLMPPSDTNTSESSSSPTMQISPLNNKTIEPKSPLRIRDPNDNLTISSPIKLLELASVCEERHDKEKPNPSESLSQTSTSGSSQN